jgi:hypothetical protein
MVTRLISKDQAAIAIATEEYLAIHRICDGHKVPRRVNDEKLTAAQRVALLAQCRKGFRE